MTISFPRHFRSRPLVFRCRGVESFLKYDSSEKNIWRVYRQRAKCKIDEIVTFAYLHLHERAYDIKNFTHNYREYTGIYHCMYTYITPRFETSACGVVHGYITFPANGSGRLE